MKSFRDNQLPDEKGLNSSNVANGAEPPRVLPKVWNGNGIPVIVWQE